MGWGRVGLGWSESIGLFRVCVCVCVNNLNIAITLEVIHTSSGFEMYPFLIASATPSPTYGYMCVVVGRFVGNRSTLVGIGPRVWGPFARMHPHICCLE